MIKAEIKPQNKKFRNNIVFRSTCNCGTCNCNCGAQRISTDLNKKIKNIIK